MSARPTFRQALRPTLIFAALVAATLADAQTTYRWIDKSSGKTVFSDQPPPPGASRVVRQTDAQPGNERQLPYATRQAAEKFPVTLYTTASCAEACQQARELLNTRGVPFTEKQLTSEAEFAELARLLGSEAGVPSFSVGRQNLRGLADDAWSELLDLAGYPKSAPYGAQRSATAARPQKE
jgi:glutaredoxin